MEKPTERKVQISKKCIKCGNFFIASSSTQTMDTKCRTEANREYAKRVQAKLREETKARKEAMGPQPKRKRKSYALYD